MNVMTKKYYVRELVCNICGKTGTEKITNLTTGSQTIVCVPCACIILKGEAEGI